MNHRINIYRVTRFLKNRQAFTLVELLMSAGILGVVIVGVVVSFLRCIELNEVSENKSMAIKAARSRMEQVKMTDFDNLMMTYNNVTFNVTGFTGKGVSYVTTIDAKNFLIRVAVCWQQKNGRVFGEDKNLNGVLDAGEDLNGDGFITSPVDLAEVIYKR